jgi:hypothetical protein
MEYLHTAEDGSTVKYTDEMIKNVIKDVQYYKDQRQGYLDRYHKARVSVYDFFKERHDTGSDEITCSVEDVNELLESMGSEKLKSLFSVSGRINFVITDIEADSEEDARDIVESELNVEFNGYGNLDEWDVDISDTSQQ